MRQEREPHRDHLGWHHVAEGPHVEGDEGASVGHDARRVPPRVPEGGEAEGALPGDRLDERVLVHAPEGRDAALVSRVLAENRIAAQECPGLSELLTAFLAGAGVLLLTEEALSPDALSRLRAALDVEPAWSDIPLVICTAGGDPARGATEWFSALEGRAHLMLLERPLHVSTLVTVVRSALRARQRQYEMRELLMELAEAAVERERLLCAERDARAAAEAASRAKDEFLATLSHELRTPLNAILGWTAMLLDGALPPNRKNQALAIIDRNARMLTQLIQDLLGVSSIISGKMSLRLQWVDLHTVVGHALDKVRPAAELKGIAIDGIGGDVHSSHVSLRGDPDRLLQIASNLLTNAVKFTPRGGRVQVQVERLGKAVRLTVSDTGGGIAPDFLPFVFDRFRQADGSTTRKFGGLGLGLAIVRHLAELHGGSVEAASEGEGQGATFAVTLPVAPAGVRVDGQVERGRG